jgi:hypothetical protein
MFCRYFVVITLLGAAFAVESSAQSIVLKDGNRIAAADLTVGDGKISRSITLSNGQKGQASVAIADILQMEWPNPKQVIDAHALMAAGKAKDAVALLQQGKDFFRQFKDVKGNPYNELVFAHVEALDAAGDFDAILKVMPEVNAIKWDDDKKTALRIIKLNMERRTSSDQEKILSEAESLREETDDTAVRAKLSMTIGDILFKKERWDEAFDAYLRVPVFYGSQASVVPQAELMAARCLVKQERFKDASAMFERISTSYPGSEVGDTAKKEFLATTGRENKPDKPAQSGNDSKKKTEEKAKS